MNNYYYHYNVIILCLQNIILSVVIIFTNMKLIAAAAANFYELQKTCMLRCILAIFEAILYNKFIFNTVLLLLKLFISTGPI